MFSLIFIKFEILNSTLMKLKILSAFGFWALLLVFSCNRDDITFDPPTQDLRFSRDTVFCDTVYHQVRSETYAVKVYNDEDKDILIPTISLFGGVESPYRINVDGKSGYEFSNVPLRKKDSLYIFVEIAPTAIGVQAIAEDQIVFQSPASTQHVTLFSVVQDAEFFVKTGSNTNILTGNINWTNNKAKIIYGDLTVGPGSVLNIQQGTKVYFHKNSGMKISAGAIMNVNGDLTSEVIFRGDRNDTKYDTVPKNWNSIRFESGSQLNMNYARIFGGTRGLDLKETTANIKNSIIHTFQEYGIYAVNSTVSTENLVMNNCGDAAFGIYKGGTYNIVHSTIANYWNLNATTAAFGIYVTNEWLNPDGQTENGALTLNLKNSVVYGNVPNSVQFKPISGQIFNYQIRNSLLKYESSAGFVFDANPNVISSLKNQDPKFTNHFTEMMNLRVAADSPAKNKGDVAVAATVPFDIVKVSRTSSPTVGAYQ